MTKEPDYTDTNFFEQVITLLQLIKRNPLIAIGSFLVPFLIFLALAYRDYPVYNSRMLIRMSYLSNNETGYFVQQFQTMIDNDNTEELDKILCLANGDSKKLKKIKTEKLKDKPESYIISVEVSDTSVLKPLAQGIAGFFETNSFINEKLAAQRKPLNETLRLTIKDLTLLDSAKKNLLSSKAISSDILPFYLTNINMSVMHLRDKKNDITQKLSALRGFQVVSSFSVPRKPEMGTTTKYIILGLFAGFFCSYAALMAIRNRSRGNNKLRG